MTRFRYWLADLISGGELTHSDTQYKILRTYADRGWEASGDFAKRCDHYSSALRAIAAEAKPTSNATVKRMARIAQDALK